MNDANKNKEHLKNELVDMRQLIEELVFSVDGKNKDKQFNNIERRVLLGDVLENCGQPFAAGSFPSGRNITCNDAFCKLVGYSKEELYNMSWKDDLVPRYWYDMLPKMLEEVIQTGGPVRFEQECTHKNGSEIPVEILGHGVTDSAGNISYIYGFFTDITERKKMEEELENHREKLEDLVRERTDELTKANEQLQQEVSERKQTEAVLERELEVNAAIANLASKLISPESIEDVSLRVLEQAKGLTGSALGYIGYIDVRTGQIVTPGLNENDLLLHQIGEVNNHQSLLSNSPANDYKFLSIYGQLPIHRFLYVPVLINNNQVGQVILANPNQDYTGNDFELVERLANLYALALQRVCSEEELRLSEERFAKAFQASPSIMTISTLSDGRYISVNDTFLRILGRSLDEVIGRKVIESNIWAVPKERAKVEQMLKEQGQVRDYEFSFRTKAGEVRSGLLSADSIELNGEKCMLIVTHDMTDLRRLEQEMTRLGRLNLIGEMAAGIAHEIRNPMTTVRGFIQILEKKELSAKHKGYYKLMIEELDRANSIITEFLSLAKNKFVNKKEKNINELLQGLLPLIQVDAIKNDKNVTVEMAEVPNLLLDEKEISQLILNLVRNGFEAMLPGGKLAIRTYTEGEEVVVAVEDQGHGIADDVLDKMGTPFFTTRDNGTGLGLAICYSIANRHNATIQVETSPEGSTFFVRFKMKATA